MTSAQWDFFVAFRENFKAQCKRWNHDFADLLHPLQKAAACKDTPDYPMETAVVYNHSLDEVTQETEIKLIVIGDNPGKDEQLQRNQRYLVGQAGKIGAGFFSRHPQLAVDFRRNTIILNKTPVHTAKTAHLRYLLKNGGEEIVNLIEESQMWMARQTAKLHQILCPPRKAGEQCPAPGIASCQLWLVGYAELKGRGLFLRYRDELAACYRKPAEDCNGGAELAAAWKHVMVYQHFSMNRFTIDLAENLSSGNIDEQLPLQEQLAVLGSLHRKEIFGR